MEDSGILDEVEKIRGRNNSGLAFRFMMISIVLMTFAILLIISNSNTNIAAAIGFFSTIGFAISTLLGFFFSIRSIVKKEPNSVQKVLAIIGNSFFLLIVIGLTAFIIMDLFVQPVIPTPCPLRFC